MAKCKIGVIEALSAWEMADESSDRAVSLPWPCSAVIRTLLWLAPQRGALLLGWRLWTVSALVSTGTEEGFC